MPVNSTIQPQVSNAILPYDRLALRCMLNASIKDDKLVSGGSLSLHGTRYRKPNPGEFEVFGLIGSGEVAASINVGNDVYGDALMLTLATIARANANVTGDCSITLSFAWRAEGGDLIGMASETVTPTIGEPVTDMCGNVNERMASDPIFAQHYAGIIQAVSTWVIIQGW